MAHSSDTRRNDNLTSIQGSMSPLSEKPKKSNPVDVISPFILTSDLSGHSVRTCLSDTEVEKRKQNRKNYAEAISILPQAYVEGCSTLFSSRFQTIDKARSVAVQKLILEDFDLKSQSTNEDSEELEEEICGEDSGVLDKTDMSIFSDANSIETLYPPSEGCLKSNKSDCTTIYPHRKPDEVTLLNPVEVQYMSPEYLLHGLDCIDLRSYNRNMTCETGMQQDCYIILNITSPPKTSIEEINPFVEDNNNSKLTVDSPPDSETRSNLKNPRQNLTTTRLSSCLHSKGLLPSNRIFPIQELSEDSSATSSHSNVNTNTSNPKVKQHTQKVSQTTAGKTNHRPPFKRYAWEPKYPICAQSLPNLKESTRIKGQFLLNTTVKVETKKTEHLTKEILNYRDSPGSSKFANCHIVPEIDVVDSMHEVSPGTSDTDKRNKSNSCNCFYWLWRLIRQEKRKTGSRIKIYKTYFCDICPGCNHSTTYFLKNR